MSFSDDDAKPSSAAAANIRGYSSLIKPERIHLSEDGFVMAEASMYFTARYMPAVAVVAVTAGGSVLVLPVELPPATELNFVEAVG